MPCKLVILLSGSGSNLQAFIDASRDGLLPSVEIRAVISNKAQAFGLERAKQAGIATACIDHTQFASREAFDAELQVCIDSYDADLVVLAGFMRILTPGFVRHYLGRLINIHPSYLNTLACTPTSVRSMRVTVKRAPLFTSSPKN